MCARKLKRGCNNPDRYFKNSRTNLIGEFIRFFLILYNSQHILSNLYIDLLMIEWANSRYKEHIFYNSYYKNTRDNL